MNDFNVEVYTKNACPSCVRVKSFLGGKGISFSESSLYDNEEVMDFARDNGIMQAPIVRVVDNEGEIAFYTSGFNMPELKEIVDITTKELATSSVSSSQQDEEMWDF